MDPVQGGESDRGRKFFKIGNKVNQYLAGDPECANVVLGASRISPSFYMGEKQPGRLQLSRYS